MVLIDGSSYLYRAFHALPPLSNAAGEPTGALFGVVNMLRAHLKERPEYIAFVVDAPGKTFRDDLYPAYKANRAAMPDDLRAQCSRCANVAALGIPILRVDGLSRATRERHARAARRRKRPMSSSLHRDKDFAQLVRPRVELSTP